MKGNIFKWKIGDGICGTANECVKKNSTGFYDRWNIYVFISRYKYSIISIDRREQSGATTIIPAWKEKKFTFSRVNFNELTILFAFCIEFMKSFFFSYRIHVFTKRDIYKNHARFHDSMQEKKINEI